LTSFRLFAIGKLGTLPIFPSTTHITAHKARNESHPPGFAPLLLFKCFFPPHENSSIFTAKLFDVLVF